MPLPARMLTTCTMLLLHSILSMVILLENSGLIFLEWQGVKPLST